MIIQLSIRAWSKFKRFFSGSLTVVDCNSRKTIALTGQTSPVILNLFQNLFPFMVNDNREIKALTGQTNIDRFQSTRQTGSHNSQARWFALSTKFGMTKRCAFTLAEVLITLGIIGVVAAMTIPTLVQKYKKHVVETRLKQSYSILNNIVNRAKADYGDIEGWDFSLNTDDYYKTYILPYLTKTGVNTRYAGGETNYTVIQLNNGTIWYIGKIGNSSIEIKVDINGKKKPNKEGIDRFIFYILPQKKEKYNHGNGDIAHDIPNGGVYYDGYGIKKTTLINGHRSSSSGQWLRGCSENQKNSENYYCIALIVQNNWKIPDDYPYKF